MKLLSTLVSLSLLSVPLTSCAAYTEQNIKKEISSPKEVKHEKNQVLEYEHFTLDNGLEVYLARNTETPRFHSQIAIKAGSKFDPSDATGIAHYLEHMFFKGTEDFGTRDFQKEKPLLDKITELYTQRFNEKDENKRKQLWKEINALSVEASKFAIPNEIDSLYGKLGEQGLNAYTSDEETVYIVDLPKNRLEQWAKVESNRFEKPVFRLFQTELETVYEEKNRSMDNKERLLWEAVSKQLYKVHPYGTQTTIGTVEHLKNPSLQKMYDFYKTYYVPNNMGIIISGDIDIKETKELITKYFSSWKRKELPKFVPPQEKELNGVEKIAVNYKGEEKVILAFRTVPYNSEDKYALNLIDMLLDSGDAGLIKLNLVNTQKVRAAGASGSYDNDYGSEYIYAVLKDKQTHEEAEKLLLNEIEKIKKGEFNEDLLKGIILSFEINKKKAIESNGGRVEIMKEAFLKNKSVEDVISFSEGLKKVTKEQIIKTANKYYNGNYVAAYRYDKEQTYPKIEKPELQKVTINSADSSNFVKEVQKIPTKQIEPKWVDYKNDFKTKSFAPGVIYYHVKNPLNDIFNFEIDYNFGDKHLKNFCNVMDELNFAGTGNLSPADVKNELFNHGLDVSFSCGDYGFSMGVSGLDSEFENGLSLAEKLLWNANLDQKHLSDKIQNIIKSRDDQKKNVNSVKSALGQYIAFDKKSGYIDRTPKEELLKLTVDDYPKMKDKLLQQNFEIYYSGRLPIEAVENTVKKYHLPAQIDVPLLNSREQPTLEITKRHDKPIKIYFLDFKGAQAHINLLISGQPVNPDERMITSLYNEYFDGGMGAIMFQEVREARSLAYSTSAGYYQGRRIWDQDQMTGYIGTQADKTIDAMKIFIQLLKNTPYTTNHFERAKQALDNAYRTGYINFRGVVGSVNRWADLGFNHDPREESFNKLQTVTFDELKSYINSKISSQNLTFTIVGDKTKINFNELKKLGDIEEVKMDKLFTD